MQSSVLYSSQLALCDRYQGVMLSTHKPVHVAVLDIIGGWWLSILDTPPPRLLRLREAQTVWGVLLWKRGRWWRRGLWKCTLYSRTWERRQAWTQRRGWGEYGASELWGITCPLMIRYGAEGGMECRGSSVDDNDTLYCYTHALI